MNQSNGFRSNRLLVALCALLLLAACAPAGLSTPPASTTQTARALHPTVTALPPQPTSMPAPTSAAAAGQIKVFISTDMSSDDMVALLYLLQHPDVRVLGIGSSDGVVHVQPAALNVLRLLALVGRQDIPVAVGGETSLEGDHAFPGAWRGGADRLFGLSAPGVAEWEEGALAIVTDGRDELGRIVLQPEKPPNAQVCLGVDVSHLQDELIDVLNR